MTVNQAIETLYRDIPVTTGLQETAVRMAVQALQLLQWTPTLERLPGPGEELVLAVCTARISEHHFFRDAIQLAEYDETSNEWILEGWPEAEDVRVSHWMPLPELPDELGEEAAS